MSSAQQLRGDSLRRQVEKAQSYAAANNLDLDEEMHDLGRSAFSGEHRSVGVLGEFLDRVQNGEIPEGSYLLVESLDRLSREAILPALNQLHTIVSKGIIVITLMDGQKYSDLNADLTQMMLSVLTMFRAHEESKTKSDRIGQAWRNKRTNAATQRLTKVCPYWLQPSPDGKSYEIVPERSAIVQRIFQESANGLGTFTIARRLNAEGIKPFGRSKGWQDSYIKKILANRSVLGEFQPHEVRAKKRNAVGDPILGYFPAVIEESLFIRARAGIATRRARKGGRTGQQHTYLFKGVLFCAACGGKVKFLNKGAKPKGGRYLACDNANRGLKCTRRLWRYDAFEAAFLHHVPIKSGLEKVFQLAEQSEDDDEAALLVASATLERLRNKANAIDESFASLEKVSATSTQKRADLETEIVGQERLVLQLKTQISEKPSHKDYPTDFDNIAQSLRDEADPDLASKRAYAAQILSNIVDRIDVSFDGVECFFAEPWSRRIDGDWAPFEDEGLFSEDDPLLRSPAFAIQFKEWLGGWLVQPHPARPEHYRVSSGLRPENHNDLDPQEYRFIWTHNGKHYSEPRFDFIWWDD